MMKTITAWLITLSSLTFLLVSAITARASASPPDLRHRDSQPLWHQLYAEGGKTFYCQVKFHRHTVFLTESYIYPLSLVRASLHCNSNRQCEKQSAVYRRVEHDLNNIVPVQTRFELKQRNAHYAELSPKAPMDRCGVRSEGQLMDPPDRIKGNIARIIAYMHRTYGLPLIAPAKLLQAWNKLDPPDADELARNQRIVSIGGQANPFVQDPALMQALNQTHPVNVFASVEPTDATKKAP